MKQVLSYRMVCDNKPCTNTFVFFPVPGTTAANRVGLPGPRKLGWRWRWREENRRPFNATKMDLCPECAPLFPDTHS